MKTVAIIGKPNVGKSTLFNRIINKRKSIIFDTPGVTRDRIYDEGEWLTRRFNIIDTGGLTLSKNDFQQNINMQVDCAINEADIIIFLTSYKNGVDRDDIYISQLLRKNKKDKKIILVANKAENFRNDKDLNSFYALGFGKPIILSSEHGIGTGDLLDEVCKNLPKEEIKTKNSIDFCIIGKPNAGKSSLANTILNEERLIVSEIPGTTRDSVDVPFNYNKQAYTLIDTAGIRRKGKYQYDQIEKFSNFRTQKSIEKSDLIILLIDGSIDITEQDEVVGGLAFDANIPTIIVINKIDLVDFNNKTKNELTIKVRDRFKYLSWAPIIFISALNNKKIEHIFNTITKINEKKNIQISTSLLNDVILKAQMTQQAPIFKGSSRLLISYATQFKSQIPSFAIFCNNPDLLHFSYARYIENKIRDAFDLNDVPVTLYWKNKNARKRQKPDEK